MVQKNRKSTNSKSVSGENSFTRRIRLINETLYRATEDENGIIQHQYVFPKHQTQLVIENVHSSIFGGHLGLKKPQKK